MHNERVSRHCKGINQALSDLKHRFGQMTEEHNQLATQFRDDIEALEIVFINATKSSKYVAGYITENMLTNYDNISRQDLPYVLP